MFTHYCCHYSQQARQGKAFWKKDPASAKALMERLERFRKR